MSITIVYTMIALSAIGILAAVILYFVAQKFKVYEDPRIDEVKALCPVPTVVAVALQVVGLLPKPV